MNQNERVALVVMSHLGFDVVRSKGKHCDFEGADKYGAKIFAEAKPIEMFSRFERDYLSETLRKGEDVYLICAGQHGPDFMLFKLIASGEERSPSKLICDKRFGLKPPLVRLPYWFGDANIPCNHLRFHTMVVEREFRTLYYDLCDDCGVTLW